MSWEVVIRPVDPDPTREGGAYNGGGLIVDVTDGTTRSTVARVAYVRVLSKHPLRSFKRQLRDAIARARAEADALNHGDGEAASRSSPDVGGSGEANATGGDAAPDHTEGGVMT